MKNMYILLETKWHSIYADVAFKACVCVSLSSAGMGGWRQLKQDFEWLEGTLTEWPVDLIESN